MKEINIASALSQKRHEKGITQEELASYIGVSKASVSKWETGQSYPDITFLPQLAAYFNISIDDLMGYAPQMTKDDIRALYHRLAAEFASQPFAEVLSECRFIIKKYYSCFPLLLQMSGLLMNHHMLAADKDTGMAILKEAAQLCRRVTDESDDVRLSRDGVSFEATCYLMLGEPEKVFDLIGDDICPIPQDTEMMAKAYQMMGNTVKAREVMQVSMYQHLLYLLGTSISYLMINGDQLGKAQEILKRSFGLAQLYDLEKLHPNAMLQLYYAAAHIYGMNRLGEKALEMLNRYTDLCVSDFFPYTLHGDAYFDAIDGWFKDFDLGDAAPRSEKIIRESMLQGITANPVFSILADDPLYKNIIKKLTENLGGNQ
ncbi:helix-turn-helix domain-containing protein [Acetobacterium bakii]|uniref:DNA-binding protein n=1 Tax=Acetobacterium bakii TaxID=52689 RepID=A0A0L6U0D7_9FIRM|nr:helix-turn-helix transcriptional regulator [Acetobacterium bakii]KNZ41285.1 DNA-binding protein [Acetobacterium bakii]